MSGQNVIEQMNQLAIDLIKTVPNGDSDPDEPRGDTGDIARTMALLNTALFDAVNGVSVRNGNDEFESIIVDDRPPNSASAAVAAAEAGRVVLSFLFSASDRRDRIKHTSQVITNAVGATPAARRDGVAWGRAVAAEILIQRSNDVPSDQESVPHREGGFNDSWRNQYARMTPFVMGSQDQFRPPPPPPTNSQRYAEDLKEVRRLGQNITDHRTEDQTAAARAWNGGRRTSRPTGAWFEAAIQLVETQNLDLRDASRLFVLLGLTICECMISSWDAKRAYDFWRPRDTIRMAHIDGNSSTEQDLGWRPLSDSKGGSPEYTSGTATFAGGASHVLATYFGTDDIGFRLDLQQDIQNQTSKDGQQDERRTEREYGSFSEAAEEAGMSRIYNGIHYQFSNKAGMEAGKQIAHLVLHKHSPRSEGGEPISHREEDSSIAHQLSSTSEVAG